MHNKNILSLKSLLVLIKKDVGALDELRRISNIRRISKINDQENVNKPSQKLFNMSINTGLDLKTTIVFKIF